MNPDYVALERYCILHGFKITMSVGMGYVVMLDQARGYHSVWLDYTDGLEEWIEALRDFFE